jgi:hypothetical protein
MARHAIVIPITAQQELVRRYFAFRVIFNSH